MQNLIEILDFTLYTSDDPAKRSKFITALRKAFSTTGFILLKNHGISSELLFKNRELFKMFFKDLPLEVRMKYHYPELFGQTGYTPIGIEKGIGAKNPDNKHFWQMGDMNVMPYVEEIPEMKKVAEKLYGQFFALYQDLMEAVGQSLDLPFHFFFNQLGNSIMRSLHYPADAIPVVEDDGEDVSGGNLKGMCAWRHKDINDLTLLHATEPGLQLLHENKWVPVLCNPDTIIVNVGEMLWHKTAGFYKSGVHRVVCQPGVERFSFPYFGHCRDEISVVPFPQFTNYDKEIFRFKTEGEFLNYILEEINLKKKD